MNQSRRQFAVTLFAGGASLFLPKLTKSPVWKKRHAGRFFSANQVNEMLNQVEYGHTMIGSFEYVPLDVKTGTLWFNTADQSFRVFDGKIWREQWAQSNDRLIVNG